MATKRFKQYIIEARPMLSVDAAMKVLGLQPGFTPAELKAAYRTQAMKYHPDRNPGDAAAELKFKDVNNANEVLSNLGTHRANDASYREATEIRHEKTKAYAEIAKSTLKQHLHFEKFLTHFASVFGEPFTVVKEIITDPGMLGTTVNYTGECANKDKSIVLTLRLSIDFMDLFKTTRLSNADEGLTIHIMTDILYNRRAVKLFQSHYQMSQSYRVLSDPTVLFPAAKLKAQSAKSQTRAFSKRDAYLTLQKEVGASTEAEWAHITIGNGQYTVAMYRTTMMGTAAWQFNANVRGVGVNRNDKAQIRGFISIIETAKSFDFLVNSLRQLQHTTFASAEDAALGIEALQNVYKQRRDEFYAELADKKFRR